MAIVIIIHQSSVHMNSFRPRKNPEGNTVHSPHFTDKETETEKLSILPKVVQLV